MHKKNQVEKLRARVEKLSYKSAARWGKFNAHEMICHLQDTINMR
jgi:hypothetical protein